MNAFVISNLKKSLCGRRVLLGVTGSIAAYKSAELVRLLKECGAEVRVILTDSAEKFITPLTLETLSGNPVGSSLWETRSMGTHHIAEARWAEVAVIAPASANSIARLAHGFANDLLSAEILAFQGKVLIAPAMNPVMWENPATQANVATLRGRGFQWVSPEAGKMACGEVGVGRMAEPLAILEKVAELFYEEKKSEKILMTLGPTKSFFDPVRFLTNRSSGKMGAALAWEAVRRGYSVTCVTGPVDIALPRNVEHIPVQTTSEMFKAVKKHWAKSDIFIGAAAVLDWEATNASEKKIKKGSSTFRIELKPTPDILEWVGKNKKPNQIILGFAAETDRLSENASDKLYRKQADFIFANDVSKSDVGFESDFNAGLWITRRKTLQLDRAEKSEIARKLFDQMAKKNANHPH